MSPAREEILGRIRAALRDVPAGQAVEVPRRHREELGLSRDEMVALFLERVADYRANVTRAGAEELPAVLRSICADHGALRLGVPPGLPEAWRPEGLELVEDAGLTAEELDSLDGALTGCELGIAETGTIVLAGGPAEGRRALTLVPDLHVCVVEAGRVVGSVPEAIRALGPAARGGRPITFVSGPSATSDIELRRVEGVHGPRRLEVVLLP